MTIPSEKAELFWSHVDKNGPTNTTTGTKCWLWTGARKAEGPGKNYGIWGCEGRTLKAHRVSFELEYGEGSATGLCVLHSCDNPPCVRPDHLFLGTLFDNNMDMVAKGRHRPGASKTPAHKCNYKRGCSHWGVKLTPEVVVAMRADRSELSFSQLSRKYGVAIKTAHSVVTRKTWKHVT